MIAALASCVTTDAKYRTDRRNYEDAVRRAKIDEAHTWAIQLGHERRSEVYMIAEKLGGVHALGALLIEFCATNDCTDQELATYEPRLRDSDVGPALANVRCILEATQQRVTSGPAPCEPALSSSLHTPYLLPALDASCRRGELRACERLAKVALDGGPRFSQYPDHLTIDVLATACSFGHIARACDAEHQQQQANVGASRATREKCEAERKCFMSDECLRANPELVERALDGIRRLKGSSLRKAAVWLATTKISGADKAKVEAQNRRDIGDCKKDHARYVQQVTTCGHHDEKVAVPRSDGTVSLEWRRIKTCGPTAVVSDACESAHRFVTNKSCDSVSPVSPYCAKDLSDAYDIDPC